MDIKLLPSEGDLVLVLKDSYGEGSEYVGDIFKVYQVLTSDGEEDVCI